MREGDEPAGEPPGVNGAAPTNGAVSTGELVHTFTREQLAAAAFQLGSLLGLHTEWTGYAAFLGKREPGSLVVLLEWIEWYRAMPPTALEKIESLPGLIRSHLNGGARAPLTGAQRKVLAAAVVDALAAVESE